MQELPGRSNEGSAMSEKTLEQASTVFQVHLTIQSGTSTHRSALNCQSLCSATKLPKGPEQLVSSEADASFSHIALIKLHSGLNVTESIVDSQSNKARGAILIHWSDQLPSNDPRLEIKHDKISIPVVLIQRSLGVSLLAEVSDTSSKAVMVSLVTEAVDSLPQYKPGMHATGQRTSKTKLNFRLCHKLSKLLYDRTGEARIIHKGSSWIDNVFQLIDEFENKCDEENVTDVYRKGKAKKISKLLIQVAEQTFIDDFPFHILMVARLYCKPLYTDVDEVNKYWKFVVFNLPRIAHEEAKSIFLPFFGCKISLPWRGQLQSVTEILYDFFRRLYRDMTLEKRRKRRMNESLKSLSVTLTAAVIFLALGKKRHKNFWKSFIEKLNLPSVEEACTGFRRALDLACGLDVQLDFDSEAINGFISHFKLFDLKKIAQILVELYPLASHDDLSWITLMTGLRAHFHSDLTNTYSYLRKTYSRQPQNFAQQAATLLSQLCVMHSMKPKEAEADVPAISSETELEMLVYLIVDSVPLRAEVWPRFVSVLRTTAPRKLKKLINLQINKLLGNCLERIQADFFVELVTEFSFIPCEIIGEFLRQYQIRDPPEVDKPPWSNLFWIIVQRKMTSVKPDILAFFRTVLAFCELRRAEGECFLQLLRLSHPESTCCPTLLTFSDGGDDSTDPGQSHHLLNELHSLLGDCLTKRRAASSLKRRFKSVLKCIGTNGYSPLRETLMLVLLDVVLPSRNELEKPVWLTETAKFVETVVNELENAAKVCDPSPPPKSGFLATFLWTVVVRLCTSLPAASLRLTNPPQLQQLTRIFDIFWFSNDIDDSATSFQIDVERVLSHEMEIYREWFDAIRDSLTENYSHFLDGKLSVQLIGDYFQNYGRIKAFHKAFYCEDSVADMSDLHATQERLKKMEKNIESLLYFQVPSDLKWRELMYVLTTWKVEINSDVLSLAKSCLSIKRDLTGLSPTDMPVKFSAHVTFDKARELNEVVSRWMSPLLDLKDTLCYFSACDSVLFRAYMEKELEIAVKEVTKDCKISFGTPKSFMTSPSKTVASFRSTFLRDQQSDEDEDDEQENIQPGIISIETFASALKQTKKLLEDLLANKARFRDLFMFEDRFKGVDVKEEIGKVANFPAFCHYNVSDVQRGIKDILELLQYSDLISTLVSVCEQYQMEGCLTSSKFQELKKQGTVFKDDSEVDQMTAGQCTTLRQKLESLLSHTPTDKLHLFDAVKESEEFFKFIRKEQFYTEEGRRRFMQQIGLITNQLYGEEYNDIVLNDLVVAFRCVSPFTDPQVVFEDLLKELNGPEIPENWKEKITTVNNNMTLIKFWFSKTQGDTLENVTRDLEAIMESGKVEFAFGSECSAILGTGPCEMNLSYRICSEATVLNMNTDSIALSGVSHSQPPGSVNVDFQAIIALRARTRKAPDSPRQQAKQVVQSKSVERRMSYIELEDFVRKLGFVENEGNEADQKRIATFQRKFELFREIFNIATQLFRLGHSDFHSDFQRPSMSYPALMEGLEELRDEQKKKLQKRQLQIAQLREDYPELLLFNVHSVFMLAQALRKGNFFQIAQLVSRLFDSECTIIEQLGESLKQRLPSLGVSGGSGRIAEELPLKHAGAFLKRLTSDENFSQRLYPHRAECKTDVYRHVVHLAYGFNLDQLLKLILKIYDGFPESYELLRCTRETSKEEVMLFIDRITRLPIPSKRQFAFVQVEELSIELQEEVLRFQLDPARLKMTTVNRPYSGTSHSRGSREVFDVTRVIKRTGFVYRSPRIDLSRWLTRVSLRPVGR